MGGADIIPGVSGGTVALILGIYERLVRAISHFDLTLIGHLRRRRWAKAAAHCDLRFLVALGCGILAAIVGLASLMDYLLNQQTEPTLAVFFGLILASSFLVARQVDRWDAAKAALTAAGAVFAFWLVGQPFMNGVEGYNYMFFCGAVAICAMILPGISGSFILLIMGRYDYVLGVIRDLTKGEVTGESVKMLAVFAGGCMIGLLSFSKLLRWLLARFHAQTMAVLCGFMVGSLRKIWPFKDFKDVVSSADGVDLKHHQYPNVWPDAIDGSVVLAIALATAAVVFVLLLDRVSARRPRNT